MEEIMGRHHAGLELPEEVEPALANHTLENTKAFQWGANQDDRRRLA